MSYYIYKHYNSDGEVIYVGQTKDMKKRQGTHKHKEHIDKITYVEVSTREIMDLYEKYYISKYNPKFNIDCIGCDYTKYLIDLEYQFKEYDIKENYVARTLKREIYKESTPYIQRILQGELKCLSSEMSEEDYKKLKITTRTLAHNIKKYIDKHPLSGGMDFTIFKLLLRYILFRAISQDMNSNYLKNLESLYKNSPIKARNLKETKYTYKTFVDIKVYHWKDDIYYIGRSMVKLTHEDLLSLEQ